jgi:hypothetical protein
MAEEILEPGQKPELPPVKIAFIIDGEVVDILHTDERLGAIFTSNPIIKNVTGNLYTDDNGIVSVGSLYNVETDEFLPKPEQPTE